MPYGKLGSTTANSQAQWPGITPVAAKPVPKFGTVQQAPRSAPQRALDYLRHKLEQVGILKRTSVQTGPAPLPRKDVHAAPLSKLLGSHLDTLANARAAHDDAEFNASIKPMEKAIDQVLGDLRSGKITRWLDPAMKHALASGDTAAFAQALKAKVLEGMSPGAPGRFDGWLDPLILTAVTQNIQANGPLTAPPPAPATAPKPLLGPNQEPLVRLQALGATADEMAPVLATLDKIADAMSVGDSSLVEQHLSTLSAQLRPLLERQDKAVKVAFAQSDGKAFMQDLRQAILARASEDSRTAVGLELEHFKGPYLKSAFDELVSGMLAANPDVQTASLGQPFDANVGVVGLRNLAQLVHTLLQPPLADPKQEAWRPTPLDLEREVGNFLDLVRSGAIAPELAQTLRDGVVGDDAQPFIDVLTRSLLASLPRAQHEQAQALIDAHLSPVVLNDVAQHGPLKPASAPTLPLQPKTHVDAPLLPPVHLGLLKGTAAQTQLALGTVAAVSQAMNASDPAAVKLQLSRLMDQLKPLLQSQPGPVRLAFTMSDGEDFVNDLSEVILEQTPPNEREFVATQLGLFMRPVLHKAFDRLVSGVLDQAAFKPGSPDDPPTSLTVGNRTYTLVKDAKGIPERLGQGNFGTVWKYENLAVKDETDDLGNPIEDVVVLKVPLSGKAAPGSAEERKRLLDDPVREGFTSVLTMGTGGGTARTGQLVGAVRTEDKMLLIYRFEGSGTLRSNVNKLNQGPTDEKVARGKLGLMLDLVGALRRLHEAKGLMHLDIALRNVLLDNRGHAVLADFGMSQAVPESSALDGASVKPGTDVLPIRWTAPEVMQGQPVTQKAEVFSLGVAFIELAWGLGVGMQPWGSLHTNKEFKEASSPWNAQAMITRLGPMPADLWPGVDAVQLQQLITRMIDADPANRPSLAEVAASPVFHGVLPEHRVALLAKLKLPVAAVPAVAPMVAPPVMAPPVPPAPSVMPAPAPDDDSMADLYQN